MAKDPRPQTTSGAGGNVASTYRASLPKILQAINDAIPASELAKLGAARQVVPGYTDLANETNRSATLANERTATDALNTSGREKAGIATEIDKGINPEFYQAKPEILKSLLGQLSSLDLNKPNVEAERLVNAENVRSGNAGNNSGTTGVSNALQFENEKLKRSAALTGALNNANAFMTGSRASFDPFGRSTVSDANNTSNTPNIQSTFQSIGDDTLGIGQGLLGGLFNYKNTEAGITAQRRDTLDRTNETMSSLPNYS